MESFFDRLLIYSYHNDRVKAESLKTYTRYFQKYWNYITNCIQFDKNTNDYVYVFSFQEKYLKEIKLSSTRSSVKSALKYFCDVARQMLLDVDKKLQKLNREIHSKVRILPNMLKKHHDNNRKRPMFLKTVASKLPTDFESSSNDIKKEMINKATDSANDEWDLRRKIQFVDTSQYFLKKDAIPERLYSICNSIRLSKDYFSVSSHKSVWNDATAGIMFDVFRGFIGFLVKSSTNSTHVPGLSLSLSDITLLDLVNPVYIQSFADFLRKRSGRFTSSIDHYMKLVKYILNPKDGWLINNCEALYDTSTVIGNPFHETAKREYIKFKMTDTRILSDTKYLREIDELNRLGLSMCQTLPKSELQHYMRLGAREFCSNTLEEIQDIHDRLKRKYQDKYGRDPFEPIEGLIRMDNPLEVITIALERESIEIMKMFTSELNISDIRHIQRHLLVSMMTLFALRSKQWKTMTYKNDNTGHLRKKELGGHMLVIPMEEIKNGASIRKRNKISILEVYLDNQNLAGFSNLLDYYIKNILPRYKGVNKGNFLFPSIHGNEIEPYRDTVCWVNGVLLPICSELGIKNVSTFGCHAFRHLGATNVLRLTGRMEDAANFLLDDFKTTERCYARLRIEKVVNRLVDLVVNDRFRLR